MKRLIAAIALLSRFCHGLDEIGQVMFQVTGVRTAGRRLDAEFDVTHFDLEGAYEISQGRYGLPQTTSSGSLQIQTVKNAPELRRQQLR